MPTHESTRDPAEAVSIRGITKRFGGTLALNQVTVAFEPGMIHALVGENGAGKSTLGKIIAGIYQPDDGEVDVQGHRVEHWSPAHAQRMGVVMIAQELALVPDMTIAENVFLGIEHHRAGIATRDDVARYRQLTRDTLDFDLDPQDRVSSLSIADRQKVEIQRALAREAKVVVFDEPTSSLSAVEADGLHDLMRSMATSGLTVIYVTHFLDHVLAVADTVTVLRNGNFISKVAAASVTKKDLVASMLGASMETAYPERVLPERTATTPLLRVAGAATDTGVTDMSFEIYPGEIVGLLGLIGSGRTEVVRAIIGADRLTAGSVELDGRRVSFRHPRHARRKGIVLVTEDRRHEALLPEQSVALNMTLSSLGHISKGGIVSARREASAVDSMSKRLDIRTLSMETPIRNLSGGNQQKAIIGRALLAQPRVVILDEPTRGVDVGAKLRIYQLIAEMSDAGLAVLLISSEHEEVINLAHRAYLVAEGRTLREVDPTTTSVERVLHDLFHVDELFDIDDSRSRP